MADKNGVDSFDDLFEPFELEDGPPPAGQEPTRPAPPPPPTQEETVAPVACPSCGTANPGYNRHCEACGARLGKDPLPVASPPMVRTTPGVRALGVLAGVVLVVALIAVVINIFGGGDEDPEAASSTTSLEPTTTRALTIDRIQPTNVTASSELNASFSASNLIDGDVTTEWQDASSRGEDGSITFTFSQPVAITEIEIANIPDDDRFKQNYRIKGYKVIVDDLNFDIPGQLQDSNRPQIVPVASVATRTLTIEITSTYGAEASGDQPPFNELALAEVSFFGQIPGN